MDCNSSEVAVDPGLARIVLVGNPNVGKSAIFGALTGTYVCVSNYPGTTVEVCHGNAVLNRRKMLIIDTPGANSLVPMSEDEQVTRDILLSDGPTAVIQVADTKNLRRALVISTQLAELELPFVLDLNMADEARSRGVKVDHAALSKALGVPVVTTVATQKSGIDRLIASIPAAALSPNRVRFHKNIEEAAREIEGLLEGINRGRRGLALAILAGDESLAPWLLDRLSDETIQRIEAVRERVQTRYTQPLGYVINMQRLKAVGRMMASVETRDRHAARREKKRTWLRHVHPLIALPIFAAAIYGLNALVALNPIFAALSLPLLILALYMFGDWGMHPILGIPILAIVLYLTWQFVGGFGAGTAVDFLEGTVFDRLISPAAQWVVQRVLPWEIARDLLVGEYGIITMAVKYAFAIVLPIVGAFFIAFGLLEDSGYLPRLAVMVDKIFKTMGLNGKAVLPMILGLGCDTMATLTARILDTKRERIIVTLLLALGVPCSAQLGVIMGILGSPGVPVAATAIWVGVVILVIFKVGFLAGMILPGDKSDFILEVPPTRLPQMENIIIKTLARVEWYVKEAVPLFVIGTLMLFAAAKSGVLVHVERLTAPVVQGFLGLPAKATEAFIVGFLRRDYGVAGLYQMSKAGQLDTTQMVVALVTITLFIPCLANFLVIVKERGMRTAIWMALFIVPYAFLIGGMLNWILRSTGTFR